jgi:hypothetical protein
MKFLLSLAALAVTCTGLAQGTSEAILGYYANGVGGYANATVGWTFQSTNALAVTALGCFANVFEDNLGVTSVQVGLWDDSGLLLASNSITPASILFDQTRYEAIPLVSLSPGQVYHLGVYYSGGLGLDVASPSTGGSVSASPAIQVDGLAYVTSGFASPLALAGTAGSIFAGPNFRFQSVPTLIIQHWTGNQVRLSWSTAFPGYSLQSKSALSGTWGNPGLSVNPVGSEFVAFDTIGAGSNFYRLVK